VVQYFLEIGWSARCAAWLSIFFSTGLVSSV